MLSKFTHIQEYHWSAKYIYATSFPGWFDTTETPRRRSHRPAYRTLRKRHAENKMRTTCNARRRARDASAYLFFFLTT